MDQVIYKTTSNSQKLVLRQCFWTYVTRGGGGGGGEHRSEAWDRETMFSQLAKRFSQNVDSGARNDAYFRSTDQLLWNRFQNLCILSRESKR